VKPEFEPTAEQRAAIEWRGGDMLLDAAAGSGKTSVLVERFVRAVLNDGVDVAAILTITFTDKAAAELRDRIRARLRSLGAVEEARATEGAFISTIHGFCARVLRANALPAGLDPAFGVLDRPAAERLADGAFEDALDAVAERSANARELLAGHGPATVRAAVLAAHDELRSRGQTRPRLPALPPAAGEALGPLRLGLESAAAVLASELGSLPSPSSRVQLALERLARVRSAIGVDGDRAPWPGAIERIRLPGGNGAALSTGACAVYTEALEALRDVAARDWAAGAWAALDELLREFGSRYEARKRAASGLDFSDLELLTRDLLAADPELRGRYCARFAEIMVDEFQDTNAVQLALIEAIADDNLFTVGDAQQSIYGFRHADLELFERRGERLERLGARMPLAKNFRSRPEILDALNLAFGEALGDRFRRLEAGREDVPPADAPCVELLIADKGSDWIDEGIAAPWRVAEARALAARVRELVDRGRAAREIVLLTRATTDLRAYERALEERGIPTYVIGGRGYWQHPQILDMVAYLRALANPRDEEALYIVLASPLVGVSLDALVVLAAAARTVNRDPWWLLQDPDGALNELTEGDVARLSSFVRWFAAERGAAARLGVEELVERSLLVSGYDLEILAMPGGTRRLANVRKLMRLGRDHEAESGPDLRGFLDLVNGRAAGWLGDPRESEAPVEGEALDAVRLMTIHRAKGLEFPIVCVADLGRAPWRGAPLLRLGRDGRVGLRLARAGSGNKEPALDYKALGEVQQQAEAEEERRLFYVAMTRAQERLVVSGAINLGRWPTATVAEPMAWVAPALVPDVEALAGPEDAMGDTGAMGEAGAGGWAVVERDGDRGADGEPVRIALRFVRADDVDHPPDRMGQLDDPGPGDGPGSGGAPAFVPGPPAPAAPAPAPPAPAARAQPVSTLSYSSLGAYARCGYRFYLERVLRLPEVPAGHADVGPATTAPATTTAAPALTPTDRGTIIHALLERLDFRRPVTPTADAVIAAAAAEGVQTPSSDESAEIAKTIGRFTASALCGRLAAATGPVQREERFAFLLDDVLVVGAIDALAWEPGSHALVVDYKSDPLEGRAPSEVVAAGYETQRLIYALAALRAGAESVDVAHVFLERPDEPATATLTRDDTAQLEARLGDLAAGVLESDFQPSGEPHRAICSGCPGENGLCSWPMAMTRREAPDRLF
jgi:ATP-dependent exoDNAse (exonuclease V) beta subunit